MKNLLSELFTKQFFIGIVVGFFLTIAAIWSLLSYWEAHPSTDCNSCIEGTTP